MAVDTEGEGLALLHESSMQQSRAGWVDVPLADLDSIDDAVATLRHTSGAVALQVGSTDESRWYLIEQAAQRWACLPLSERRRLLLTCRCMSGIGLLCCPACLASD